MWVFGCLGFGSFGGWGGKELLEFFFSSSRKEWYKLYIAWHINTIVYDTDTLKFKDKIMWSICVYTYALHFAFVFINSKMFHFEFQAVFYEWYKVF